MSIRVCHPFGSPNSYNAAVSFLETGHLQRFHTLIYRPFGLPRRGHPELPRRYVTSHPTREIIRLAATHLPTGSWSGRRQGFVDWVARNFDKSTARAVLESDKAVYCYEDSAEATFGRAHKVGAMRIYELPTLHYRELRRIFESEISKEPELGAFLQSLREPAWKLERKDRELLSADIIVVPGRFVRQSIERFLKPTARILTAPYGSDLQVPSKNWSSNDQSGPLRLFFAGNLKPSKGVHVLFDALARIRPRDYHLTLAGRWEPGFREWVSKKYSIDYDWLGQLPHDKVYEMCRQAHVFVFPSLAEGFGLVILEAMASGIPVVATDHTAGPEVIADGVDGWIVPAGNASALEASLETAMGDRARVAEMGVAARRKAEFWSWGRYRSELSTKVSDALAQRAILS